jgi:hypothetical protein
MPRALRSGLIATPCWAAGLNRSKRTSPGKARKAGVVPVRCDPFAAGLNSQSRKPCVLREVAGSFGLRAHFFEDRPMTIAGFGDRRIRLLEKCSAEIEDIASRAGISVDSMVSCNPDYARQHLRRNPVGGRTVHNRFQPFLVLRVILRVRTKSVDEDVDVRKDQSRSSIRSSSEALSLRSIPGNVPPPAWHSGNTMGRCIAAFMGRRSTSSSPCSMREVRVVLRFTASWRARSKRASSRRTVVLMCQSILSVCLYVN